MVSAILKELEFQKDFLKGEKVETIYLGGGTPSLLSTSELNIIFEKIYTLHPVVKDAEITLEANPDDLTKSKLKELKDTPVNRLSIGIQSFFEEDLKFMNRAHNAEEAQTCIENAMAIGFENLTVDLIYGTPTMSDEQWNSNIQKALDFQIPHLSCYCLTVEPNTALHHFVKTKKAPPVDEEQASRQFELLIEKTTENSYIHYEISNFALEGCYSKHNSSYWKGKPYLGIGPSAHSFDGQNRQWNVAHNQKYLRALQKEAVPFEKEILTTSQRYNEYVMTSLRTTWGSELKKINLFDEKFGQHFLQNIKPFLEDESVIEKNEVYILSTKGKLLADRIAMELFFDE
jgi:oxygen-independent coproporphyrinogen-3 oxidase